LKLYKSIEIGKLAGFLDVEKDALRELLLVFKLKSKQIRWEEAGGPGGLLRGENSKLTDLDFGIDDVYTLLGRADNRTWSIFQKLRLVDVMETGSFEIPKNIFLFRIRY